INWKKIKSIIKAAMN
uniref:Mastoparan-V1 n=1 Tax=Vespula vulgaris TaxID=7454 RepID=MAST1_VESVU|nr:RecName: Full=Mastoparan-V1; Short=MP-V1 [Vespula vulgaris]prf//1312417A mast cell degranulating peptide [Vespula vulgaris]